MPSEPTVDQLTADWLQARKALAEATERETTARLTLNRAVGERQIAAERELDLFRKINMDRDRAGLAEIDSRALDKPSGR